MALMLVWDIGYPDWVYDGLFTEDNKFNAYVAYLLNADGTEKEIVAYIMLQLDRTVMSSFIQGLYVEEVHRNRGIAKRLINEAENYSKSIGCKEIKVEILSHLSSFYYKLGYSACKRITDNKYIISKPLPKTNSIKKDDNGWDR